MTFIPLANLMRTVHIEPWSEAGVVGLFAVSTACWGLASLTARRAFAARRGSEFANRVISLLHSILSVIASGCFGLLDEYGQPHWAECGAGMTGLQQIATSISGGYFIADTVGICLSSEYFDWLFLAHHFACAGILIVGNYFQVLGFAICLGATILEACNPFMHTRWLLLAESEARAADTATAALSGGNTAALGWFDHTLSNPTALRASALYRANELCFFFVFFAMRLAFGPFLVGWFFMSEHTPFFIKAASFGIFVFSAQFFAQTWPKYRRGEKWM